MDDLIMSLFCASLAANVAMIYIIFGISKAATKHACELEMYRADEFRRQCERYHRQQIRFIDTTKCDEKTINKRTAEWMADGYKIDKDYNSNHLIAFVKDEIIKEE